MVKRSGRATAGIPPVIEAALRYKQKGWEPLPLRPGEKRPVMDNWQSKTLTGLEIQRDFHEGSNVGVRLGAPSGGLTDVDLDCPEVLSMAGEFLPDTNAIFGRPGAPASHWLYQFPEPLRTKQFRDPSASEDDRSMLLELRSTGAQTAFPPSTHPSGETIAWARDGEPARPDPKDFQDRLGKLAAAVLLVRHWHGRGSRHDLALALAGTLLRGGMETEEAEDFVQIVAHHAGDAEVEDRVRCVRDTAKRLHAGGPATGIPSLVDLLEPKIVAKLCDWLAIEHQADPIIDEFNAKHALVMVGARAVILHERQDHALGVPTVEFLRKADFELMYQNRKIRVPDGNEKIKLMPAAPFWLQHERRRSYEQVVFAPGVEVKGSFNLWRGFAVEAVPGDCSLFLDHVRDNVCKGDPALYEYVLAWMADVVQNPIRRPGTALVLRGRQGTGKGIFSREFGELFGRHFTQVSQSRHLVGHFNSHLKDCLVLFADEAYWAGDPASEGALKALITEPTLLIEMKGKDAFPFPNLIRLIIASNNAWVVPAGLEERRFCMLDVGESHMQDQAYFKAIINQMGNGGRGALLHHLMNFDASKVDLRRVPKTQALLEQKQLSMSMDQKWWFSKLEAGHVLPDVEGWPEWVSVDALYDDYAAYAGKSGTRWRGDKTSFGMRLSKLVPGMTKSRRKVTALVPSSKGQGPLVEKTQPRPVYRLPSLAQCREAFDQLLGWDYAWPDEDEGDDDGSF